ncbi:MAG: glycoside hydrolase family 97 protein [Prolixibacteraceae bacterium]
MKIRPVILFLALSFGLQQLFAALPAESDYIVKSPNQQLSVVIKAGSQLSFSVYSGNKCLLAPSVFGLEIIDGETLGKDVEVKTNVLKDVNTTFKAINYRRSTIVNNYTEFSMYCRRNFSVEFRVYNDAIAYRFVLAQKNDIYIKNEIANFNFPNDYMAFIPYLRDYRGGQIFNASFESPYTEKKLSEFEADSLAILPLMVNVGDQQKVVILEADLEDYPGMYLNQNDTKTGLKGVFAPYPLAFEAGGYKNMNSIPTERANYIAKVSGKRSLPWRVIAVSNKDIDLLNNDIVQKLASPPRFFDYSWIEPGQAAWDWWNDYNISGVDFKAGINTNTYKYYIDFAADKKLKYIIMDWNWSSTFDLTEINPEIDLDEIVSYAKSKNVGIILWAAWKTILDQMEVVFPKYSAMGIKGWKIDFIDRDDQLAVASTYAIAELAAKYKFIVDFHGVFKPTGLQRTYPNVVGYEGVYGLENFKWADMDAPRYAVTIPFIRNMAGPMDYTSGALRNVSQADYFPRNHAPLSKGTRCNQMAQYIVFEVPVQMLSDSPVNYNKESETTFFITKIPSVFDETIPLGGEVGEYVVVARKKGDTWFLGAMSNWTARDVNIDLSFLDRGKYRMVTFKDGANADVEATDYKKENVEVKSGDQIQVHLAKGGGWVARIDKL